jgi:hypothetical protein
MFIETDSLLIPNTTAGEMLEASRPLWCKKGMAVSSINISPLRG